jgi:hypothetical protein
MELNYMVIVAFITFVVAEILKVFSINKKILPLVNLGIGIVAAVVCYFTGILPSGSPLQIAAGLISCVIASCGAGGFYDVLKTKIAEKEISTLNYEDAVKIYGEPEGDIPEAPVNHTYDEEAQG